MNGKRIYPGHGFRYARLDSRIFTFAEGKSSSFFYRKTNPRKIAWTTFYRKENKKGSIDVTTRRRTRKTQKLTRAIVGASLEAIKDRRKTRPSTKAASKETIMKEMKEQKKARRQEKKEKKKTEAGGKADNAKRMPKSRPNMKGR